MSSYPPPPPGQPASGYPPPFDRRAWKAQQRMMQAQQKTVRRQQKAQARWQRAQLREVRYARRGSIVGPLLIVTLGIVFLLTQSGNLSWSPVLLWFAHWWPAVMIGFGILLLLEWALMRQRGGYAGPVLGGGVVFLLILLASIGWSLRYANAGRVWTSRYLGSAWGQMLGESYESDTTLDTPITATQTLVIRNPHGDITLTGSSPDNEIHVSVHKQVYAWKSSEADHREDQLQPVLAPNAAGQMVLTVSPVTGGEADLTIETPHTTAISIDDSQGDINLSEVRAPVSIFAGNGNVDLSAIDGAVNLRTADDDATLTIHSITGPITASGRSGDITCTDIHGSLTLQGDFFGTTDVERVDGMVRFATSRTQFQAARLDGELDVDGSSGLDASQVLGPVAVDTRNRDVSLDGVEGRVSVTNSNGSVDITNAPPLAAIQVNNQHGSVDVGVPAGAGFTVHATTQHGDIENDFGLNTSGSDEAPALEAKVNGGGPQVNISTTDGDIAITRSAATPLPPVPPAPPRLTTAPPAAPAHPTSKKQKL